MIQIVMAALVFHAYTIVGEDGGAIARVVTSDDRCPAITLDARNVIEMSERTSPAEVPERSGGQADSKPAAFPVRSCELALPKGTRSARVGNVKLPLPVAHPRRILFIGDTGCRMKASEDAWQECKGAAWPFARVSRTAARMKPDLVVHVGDIHYRESPCPEGDARCAGSPWGYGFDAWNVDFFEPAAALLKAAPWVAVRGNHESCWRAGQGWFRFMEPGPFTAQSSCDDPANDAIGDFTPPYAVPLADGWQLIVFDSSRTASKRYKTPDETFRRYEAQLRQVDELATKAPHSIFVSHHPILGFGSEDKTGKALPGNVAMQQVMETLHAGRLFPASVALAIHGHVHLFEALSFESDHPSTFVTGNSGSQMPEPLATPLPDDAQPAPGAVLREFTTQPGFGFLMMERAGSQWRFTERDVDGKALANCTLRGERLHCIATSRSRAPRVRDEAPAVGATAR